MRSHVVPRDSESVNAVTYSASESLHQTSSISNAEKMLNKKKTREKNALVFTNLAFAHAVVVFVELVDRTLGLGNGLLAAGLGPLVACFDFLGLTFTPLPVLNFLAVNAWAKKKEKKCT